MRSAPLSCLIAFVSVALVGACASSPPPAPPQPVAAPAPAAAPQPEPEPAPAAEALSPAPAPAAAPETPEPAAPAAVKPAKSGSKPAPAAAKAETAAYTGPNPCTHAVGGKGIIDHACARGGIKEAKAVMKDMVKKAKKQGVKMDCDSCHKDENNWALFTDDAKEKFKQLVELSQK